MSLRVKSIQQEGNTLHNQGDCVQTSYNLKEEDLKLLLIDLKAQIEAIEYELLCRNFEAKKYFIISYQTDMLFRRKKGFPPSKRKKKKKKCLMMIMTLEQNKKFVINILNHRKIKIFNLPIYFVSILQMEGLCIINVLHQLDHHYFIVLLLLHKRYNRHSYTLWKTVQFE
jgi:hypothetical protein